MFKKNLLIISVLALLITPTVAYAIGVPGLPLVPCGRAGQAPCTQCDLFQLVKNIIDFITGGLMPALAILLFVWAGFLILLGGANPSLVARGKTIFTTTFYGIMIMLAAWMITNTLIKSVGAKYDNANNWWKFTCTADAGTPQDKSFKIVTAALPNANPGGAYSQTLRAEGGTASYAWAITGASSTSKLPDGLNLSTAGVISGTPTATAETSNFTVKVTDSSTPPKSVEKQLSIAIGGSAQTCGQPWEKNLCEPRQMGCSASACGQYEQAINLYAGRTGVSNGANFLKAIMIKESTCNISADSGHAYGLMQLVPSTANTYRSRCGVTNSVDSAWLKNPQNASASICIAAEYIKALTQTSCGNRPRDVAAGYNGGPGACQQSGDCSGEQSCGGGLVKRWECLYDDSDHKTCNTGYAETRDYATKVLYCYNNPGSNLASESDFSQSESDFSQSANCTTYDLGGETPSLPAIQAFNNRLIIAARGNQASGNQTFINEWDPQTQRPLIPDVAGKSAGGWLWVQSGSAPDTPQLTIQGTSLSMYVKGYLAGTGALDQTYKTYQLEGQSAGAWAPWALFCDSQTNPDTTCAITPGPQTTAFGGKTYTVSQDAGDNSVLLKECRAGDVTIFQASTDFSSTNGSPSAWSYIDAATGQKMTSYYAGTSGNTHSECGLTPCWRGSKKWMLVFPGGQYPASDPSGHSIRRWTAPDAGSARITGAVKDIGGKCKNSDGVYARVSSNALGSSDLGRFIDDGDTSGNVRLDTTIRVNKDDAINFIVSPLTSNVCDSTEWDPKIEFNNSSLAPNSVTVKKVFFGISPIVSTIQLDGLSPTTRNGDILIWNNVTLGLHRLFTTMPVPEAFLMPTCIGSVRCLGPTFTQSTELEFTFVTGGSKNVSIIYGSREFLPFWSE